MVRPVLSRVDRPRVRVEPVERLEQRRRLGGRVPAAAVEEFEPAQPVLAPHEPSHAGNGTSQSRQRHAPGRMALQCRADGNRHRRDSSCSARLSHAPCRWRPKRSRLPRCMRAIPPSIAQTGSRPAAHPCPRRMSDEWRLRPSRRFSYRGVFYRQSIYRTGFPGNLAFQALSKADRSPPVLALTAYSPSIVVFAADLAG